MFPHSFNPVAGIFVYNQLQALKNLGVEFRVIVPSPFFPGYFRWHKFRKLSNKTEPFHVYYLPTFLFPAGFFFSTQGFFYRRSLVPFIKSINSHFNFDLIHAHTIFPDAYACVALKNVFRRPLVSTVHGSDLLVYPNYNRWVHRFVGQALQESELVIASSRKLAASVRSFIKEKEPVVIPNGYDPNLFYPKPPKPYVTTDEVVRMLYLGNLVPVKGVEYLLQALAKVLKTGYNVQLDLVGDGYLKKQLQSQVYQLKIQAQVKFCGRVPQKKVPEWINRAAVVVLPSLSEGFGCALLEAMACKKPVIGSAVGGIKELIVDGVNGLLVPPRDVLKLTAAIACLVQNPALRSKMGKAAYAYAQKNTWEKSAKKLLEQYTVTRMKST
ncbi:MAG: hypothetical protein RLZ12_1062 [Bacillota bacterium]|jgi:glycosyltransferase involved in cell wall biosynthesis